MNERKMPTEEQLDYLREMMNIGAGNAATALSQFLHCNVEMSLPVVYVLSADKALSVFEDPAKPAACVQMHMLGEIRGEVLFVMSLEHQKKLLRFLKTTLPKELIRMAKLDITLLEEIANIVTGVFLTALHDFSRVNICHTVPVMALDMIRSLVDECTSSGGGEGDRYHRNRIHHQAGGNKDRSLPDPGPGIVGQALLIRYRGERGDGGDVRNKT